MEAVGYSGGIWILWDRTQLDVETISIDEQVINVLVWGHNKIPWLLTDLYASPNSVFRFDLWAYLTRLGQMVNLHWLLIVTLSKRYMVMKRRGVTHYLLDIQNRFTIW